MLLNHKGIKLLISGRSGTGKTTFFCRYLLGSRHPRVWVYDHQGEMRHRPEMRGWPIADSLDELGEIAESHGRVVYDPAADFPGALAEGWDTFCAIAFELVKRGHAPLLLGADEIQQLGDALTISPEFAACLETGRRYGLDLALSGQQLNIIHNRIRNQATEIVAFAQGDERALKFLGDMGVDVEKVRALPPHHYVHLDTRTGKISSH
jgi:hypothetical protein